MSKTGRQRKSVRRVKFRPDSEQTQDGDVRPKHAKRAKSRNIGWWTLCKVFLYAIFIVPVALLCTAIVRVTSPIFPHELQLAPPPEWTGPLEPNQILASAERLFHNQLVGAESIVYNEGHLYTGTADGKVLQLHIENDQLEVLATFETPPCKGEYDSEPRCGRPLGMRLDNDGHHLIVMDAYLGIFRVDVTTGDYDLLLPSSVEIEGAEPKFLNDLDIALDGTIYFTDSSAKWQRRQFLMSLLEGSGDGRLVKYDVATNTTQVLLEGLHLANGVQLSRKEDYVLVTESAIARIMKYHIRGPKKGQSEIFADNLPGLPDNIRRSRSGGYWVPVSMCRKDGAFSLPDFFASRPTLRAQLAKIPIQFLQMMLAHQWMPKCHLILQLSEEGEILRSLQDPENSLQSVSEVEDVNGVLYLGSYHAPYIGKLDLTGNK